VAERNQQLETTVAPAAVRGVVATTKTVMPRGGAWSSLLLVVAVVVVG
jgi:hypothetical protein